MFKKKLNLNNKLPYRRNLHSKLLKQELHQKRKKESKMSKTQERKIRESL